MEKVILKTMEIEHFKGVKSQKIDFTDYTEIIGDNGTGKSTINEAYMWCIFSKNTFGNVVSITPRDENNRIIPKVESVVRLTIEVNGIEHTLCRKQKQVWRTNKSGVEVFNGYTQERYFNETPCSVSEYTQRINEVCSIDNWFMLSSIYAFMGMKQDDRRKMLIQLAGDIKEEELLQQFPALVEATHNLKVSIADLQKQKKIAYTKIEKDIEEIPTRIDELAKQTKEYDFEQIEKDIAEKEKEICKCQKEIDKLNSLSSQELIEELKGKVKLYKSDIHDIEVSLEKERSKNEKDINDEIKKTELSINKLTAIKNQQEKLLKDLGLECEKQDEKIKENREEWIRENEKEFDVEGNSVCPTCGRPHDSNSSAYLLSLQEEFYKAKDKKLNAIVDEVKKIKANKEGISNRLVEAEGTIISLNSDIATDEQLLKELKEKFFSIPTLQHAILSHQERTKLLELVDEIEKQISKLETSTDNIEQQNKLENERLTLKSHTEELRSLQEQLYQKSVNENIKNRIETLEKESYQLAQDKVDCKFILSEIDKFKKARIEVVEEKVSGLFEIVKWKMYEPNVSNDGEKEICQALINGKAYEEQNTATKVNASVDIINGLSKALNISLPLFIDNKESVTNKISSDAQIIALSVVKGAKLSIN